MIKLAGKFNKSKTDRNSVPVCRAADRVLQPSKNIVSPSKGLKANSERCPGRNCPKVPRGQPPPVGTSTPLVIISRRCGWLSVHPKECQSLGFRLWRVCQLLKWEWNEYFTCISFRKQMSKLLTEHRNYMYALNWITFSRYVVITERISSRNVLKPLHLLFKSNCQQISNVKRRL